MFLLAYTPIYIIAAFKTVNNTTTDSKGVDLMIKQILANNYIPIALVVLTLLLVLYFLIYSKLILNPQGNPIFTINKITSQHKEYVTYLGTYILPFVAIKTSSNFDMAAVVVMFLTIGFIYAKTNLIYTNPTLALFGFEIYEVEDDNGHTYDCISKDEFKSNEKVCGTKLGTNTFIISKWKGQNLKQS